ncbi:serine/threonine-protein kinase/endoribonuclease IRE1a [Selaginella moellendorffii]|nr:serine/threonine-protein kinase/endoribonuclease IRE1a [Selaginella moellendorffii]|eukprot:XP_002979501.2 serine/threonine-protein kinase/endoribonuclease IRE1a [Selaginella moellendorffii]
MLALLLLLVPLGLSGKSTRPSAGEISENPVAADLTLAQAPKFSDSSLGFRLTPDGTVHAIDDTGKYFWSFSSGGSSLVEIEPIEQYADEAEHFDQDYETLKKYIAESPIVSEGGVVIGASLKSVFVVDPSTGTLIHKFDINGTTSGKDAEPLLSSMLKDFKPLFLTLLVSDGKPSKRKFQGTKFTPIIVEPPYYLDYLVKNHTLPPVSAPSNAILALPSGSNPRNSTNSGRGSFPVGWLFGALLACLAVVTLVLKGVLHFGQKEKQKKEKEQQQKRKKRRGPKGDRASQENVSKQVDDAKVDQPKKQDADGRIGSLTISKIVIGYGSHGTRILEGKLDQRQVAVKSILSGFYHKASKEIAALIELDTHPNVVRYYSMEQDNDFVYIALERCSFNLETFILVHAAGADNRTEVNEFEEKELQEILQQKLTLWDRSCLPSPLLMRLMRDVLEGLVHLHKLGYVHRDLKPQNVLILRSGTFLSAKISDMGISKRLNDGASGIDKLTTGMGSSGWQAPEQIQGERQTRAVDMFSVGCLLYFCITGGQHPFGGRLERDMNIVSGKMDLFAVDHYPEAIDIISSLLAMDPKDRPTSMQVKLHPFFWPPQQRLQFLITASDRVEREDREASSAVLTALEAVAPTALGGAWDEKLDPLLINNLGRYRQYNYQAVRDLLRVIRNKANHYRELPADVQQILGSIPQGYESYFRTRFPKLLMEVYKVIADHCWEEEMFQPYFSEADDYL